MLNFRPSLLTYVLVFSFVKLWIRNSDHFKDKHVVLSEYIIILIYGFNIDYTPTFRT